MLSDMLISRAVSGALRAEKRLWTAEDDDFLRRNVGRMTDAEMARALGRTEIAVHLRRKRDLRLPAPSKLPGFLTANRAAEALGVDAHCVYHWMRIGLIPARQAALEKNILLVSAYDLTRWAVNWRHWIYFDIERVRDARLRRLCFLRRERWGDAWWTTEQAAAYFGTPRRHVTKWLADGRLRGVQRAYGSLPEHGNDSRAWRIWYIRRSDVVAHKNQYDFWRAQRRPLTDETLDFIRRERAAGTSWRALRQMIKYCASAEALRSRYLRQKGVLG